MPQNKTSFSMVLHLFNSETNRLYEMGLIVAVDDPLDAVAVHLGGGAWGVIALPLWGRGGVVYGASQESVAVSIYTI